MSNNTQPEIRFPGFTEDWEERKLIDLVVRLNKSTNSSRLPKVEFEDIVAGEGRLNKDVSQKFDNRKGIEFLPNDILYGKLRPYLKNWLKATFTGVAIGDFWVFRAKKSDSDFIYSLIQADRYQKAANDTSGTKMPRSDWKKVSDTVFYIPNDLKEQQKIGIFFKKLDDTITLHQRKLDLLKETKKGFLQKMFPKNGAKVPEIRFPGFTEDWEQRRLSDVASIVGGGTPSTSNPEYWDGDIDWYAPAEIGDQIYVSKSLKTITELGQQKSSAKILPIGTVLFTSRAGIGNTAILAKEGTTNQGFQSIVPHKNKLDSYFIFSRTHELKRYGEVTGAGSTFAEVSGKQMAKMPILIPCINEQRKIGAFFEQLDTTITLHQRELDVLKETKKGFLQKMFV
ncbi:TPA: restriction endonuclease subunit S [Enterococcus faecium]|uniref:restriction endonuclease subunit S n=1 Tax=Enterococcus faecium TaxID=1352 RepID=UPI0002A1A7CC|nr:restriction endonuclease subunit S [Enterococcus faecium]EGP4849088.1 restriction endonuclease subunit S [Enterococcus faecium]ELA88519.1 type I restriction modification DNA specificity protein [Enterococcus faecium EnGen0009]NTQ77826.1 restriction endonuclease subunit S [Enterococcus faecium]NTR80756.1 restriction endonuclease subunit S [Enterococcus faecium]HAQ0425740.1 restriction endonuclease subunit S [Enterococcus faecium]